MESENIGNMCRICLNAGPFIELNVKHKKLKLDYYSLLNSCASLQAEQDDNLPSKVCKKCQKSLVNCYQFRKTIIEGDIKLKFMVNSKKKDELELSIKNEEIKEENKVKAEEVTSDNEIDNTDNFENISNTPPDLVDIKVEECKDEKLKEKLRERKAKTTKYALKKMPCQTCGKLVSKNKFKCHMRIHTGEKPYQCESCPKSFRRLDYLRVHRNIHTGERKFECEICHKTYSCYANLYNHNRLHTNVKPYMCSFCGKSFTLSGHLHAHTRRHTGETPFKCEKCDKLFMQSGDLTRHIRYFHEKQRNFECSVCKKKFARSVDVKKHMMVHTGERPYQCDICSRSFNNKSNLSRHVQKMHLNV